MRYPSDDEWDYFEFWPGPTDPERENPAWSNWRDGPRVSSDRAFFEREYIADHILRQSASSRDQNLFTHTGPIGIRIEPAELHRLLSQQYTHPLWGSKNHSISVCIDVGLQTCKGVTALVYRYSPKGQVGYYWYVMDLEPKRMVNGQYNASAIAYKFGVVTQKLEDAIIGDRTELMFSLDSR